MLVPALVRPQSQCLDIFQVVFAHIWLLLIRNSSIARKGAGPYLTALLFASAAETLVRFLIVAFARSWREFLYVMLCVLGRWYCCRLTVCVLCG